MNRRKVILVSGERRNNALNIKTITKNETIITSVISDEVLVTDVGTALDLIASVSYETGCNAIILNQSALSEAFFDLKTRIAGDILQKFINYSMKLAVVGDFSRYTSKSLKDFFYECNAGKDLFFLPSEQEAIDKLILVTKHR